MARRPLRIVAALATPRVLPGVGRPCQTKDGWIGGCCPIHRRNWTKVLSEIGRADVCGEQASVRQCYRAASARRRSLRDTGGGPYPRPRTSAEWLTRFKRLDIPSQRARASRSDLLEDPHLADVGFFTPNRPRHAGHAQRCGRPSASNICPWRLDLPPPLAGADHSRRAAPGWLQRGRHRPHHGQARTNLLPDSSRHPDSKGMKQRCAAVSAAARAGDWRPPMRCAMGS